MSGGQKDRQKAARRAKVERRAAQRRAAQRRQRFVTAGAIAVTAAMVAVVVLAIGGGGGDGKAETDVATSGSSTTAATAPSPASAAGKPCVKVADPLPAGAPEVPVKEGAPPEKLVMEDLVPGTGAVVPPEATVTVNYIGVACSTGKIFDSSYSRGQPATFALTGVIPGWTQGIPGMKVGGRRLLGIPSALAYGEQGNGNDIAPDEPLWFVVEVTEAKAS